MQASPGKKIQRKPQIQDHQPGDESQMDPRPAFYNPEVVPAHKLKNKVALITGGDSGIGRAIAVRFAQESCDIAIVYLDEDDDAHYTRDLIREITGKEIFLVNGDVGKEHFCHKAIELTVKHFGQLDILINNSAVQFPAASLQEITERQLELTFRTNIYSYFFMTKAALNFMKEGGSIINTTSVTAYRGSPELIDYASTKGAIVSFTRSMAANLISKGIRVNGVAPGPVWTPLIPSSFNAKKVAHFGSDSPIGRVAQPVEIAPAYLYLACDDSAYMTGQVLHPNGGEIVNG